MRTPLSPHLSPNVETQDIRFVASQRFLPWKWLSWKHGEAIRELHSRFKAYFQASGAFSYDSGRSALTEVIRALQLDSRAHVVVQAFSCIVVPNSVIAAGAKPVFVDIDNTYNIDPEALRSLIEQDPSIKAVVVQHTFGTPADMDAIMALCQRHNIAVIEDCAHALGATFRGKQLGTFGVAAIFSFGRDKVLSTVSGGIAITQSTDIAARLEASWKQLSLPSRSWIAKRLQHPLIFWLGLHTYYMASIGKVIIALAHRFRLFPVVLTAEEKHGKQMPVFRFPNVLAQWALLQFDRLERFTTHRRKIANMYSEQLTNNPHIQLPHIHGSSEDAIFFRYTIEIAHPKELLKTAKNDGILLGDWYTTVLAPADCSLESVGYTMASCPHAETAITRVVNLPTHPNISFSDAQRIVDIVIKHVNAMK